MTARRRFAGTTAAVVVVLGFARSAAPASSPARPSSKDVIARARAYVETYRRALSTLVAEERYTQQVTGAGARTLVSDFAVVRADDGTWVGFRDVWQVDGRELPDRRERAERLFGAGRLDWTSARQIIAESARLNIGSRVRDFNTPIVALELLSEARRDWCRVKARPSSEPKANGLWSIDLQETKRPTLIRTVEGKPAFARALYLVDPDSGVITRSELRVGAPDLVTVVVHFRQDAGLELWLPHEMKESFQTADGAGEGGASYTRWRRFQATVRIVPVPGGG